ncbi:hypothetical protein BegalDRAFT_3433 [Beggiatoa alba B18LD]|uniref:Uncharacterized protein n=1 Tax=Beggiatoa alba B18LD TaxID=395493 RepID=I3CKV4_9GAMM|nr:hypothetical protein BegalDRAFT_3433 [Beggiatoa alba B18LD]
MVKNKDKKNLLKELILCGVSPLLADTEDVLNLLNYIPYDKFTMGTH